MDFECEGNKKRNNPNNKIHNRQPHKSNRTPPIPLKHLLPNKPTHLIPKPSPNRPNNINNLTLKTTPRNNINNTYKNMARLNTNITNYMYYIKKLTC